LRFQPYTAQAYIDVCNPQVEKVIESRAGRPTVAFVWKKGNAFAAGLREGDVLIKADDRPLLSYDDYARFRYLIGRVYTFTVEDRQGVRKEVKMTW
jgi:S1-C subfamily serine protease